MYRIRDFDSVNSEGVDYFRTVKGMDTNGNLIAYCKLPELEPEEEDGIELTESEHDDIVFGRYVVS